MKKFFKILISNSNDISSRRVIAILMLIPFWLGTIFGVVVGLIYRLFDFFALSIGLSALTIYITYYALTWEHAKDISNSRLFKRGGSSYYDNDLIDP